MTLGQLFPAQTLDGALAALQVASLAYDSRAVREGALFFCVPGLRSDGHEHALEALQRGAAALVVERRLALGAPEVLVPSARAAMAPVAARFYGDPSSQLRVFGVTGTNGKTTTAFLVRLLLEAAGEQCGLLGTIKSVLGGAEHAVARTTPEAIDLQANFRTMLDGGDRCCAMEVSSHALQLGRSEAVHFEAAIFTNLTQDHLDFHEGMEDYFQAKRRLFVPALGSGELAPRRSVVNLSDRYGLRLAEDLARPITYAVGSGPDQDPVVANADYQALEVRCHFKGCSFLANTPSGSRQIELPLPGRFNVANALAALATVHAFGVELDLLVAALQAGVRVPGRFEAVDEGQDFAVLVDYAHTPDSLQNALSTARELTMLEEHSQGRVLCVFGAGGDRDRGKRPLMGAIAARLAEGVIVTSDNPRSEDPEAIVAEILEGAQPSERPTGALPLEVEVDRRAAIAMGVALARHDDVLVIAGKGHEQGQELAGGQRIPFDDVTVAREALRANAAVRNR
jgi:UDP-N-acetylmuramoyl-L-alanyl-D-glutamate--2,6-diaminopimelate ligase